MINLNDFGTELGEQVNIFFMAFFLICFSAFVPNSLVRKCLLSQTGNVLVRISNKYFKRNTNLL